MTLQSQCPGRSRSVRWRLMAFGNRSEHTGISFIADLKVRLANRVQLTTDSCKAYLKAVSEVDFDTDYAMLNKIFETDYANHGRYSRPKCIGATLAMASCLVDHVMKMEDVVPLIDARILTQVSGPVAVEISN